MSSASARAQTARRRPVTDAEYEAARADGLHFIVSPSDEHVDPSVERIVLRNERFWVVEKAGKAAEVTEALDPRDQRAPLRGARPSGTQPLWPPRPIALESATSTCTSRASFGT